MIYRVFKSQTQNSPLLETVYNLSYALSNEAAIGISLSLAANF